MKIYIKEIKDGEGKLLPLPVFDVLFVFDLIREDMADPTRCTSRDQIMIPNGLIVGCAELEDISRRECFRLNVGEELLDCRSLGKSGMGIGVGPDVRRVTVVEYIVCLIKMKKRYI